MRLAWLIGLIGFASALPMRAGEETNLWPVCVIQHDDTGTPVSWTGLGPLLFSKPNPEGGTIEGFRPFYVRWDYLRAPDTTTGKTSEVTVLYPLFFYRQYGDTYEWSVFQLINRTGSLGPAVATQSGHPSTEQDFDIWPFYFSRSAPDPEDSYHAVFPLFGDLKGHFGFSELEWTLFPLYLKTERKGATSTYIPWPIIRSSTGSIQGLGVWPLYGQFKGPGPESHRYALWPLFWDNFVVPKVDPDAGLEHQTGFIPFFTREERPGSVNVSYAGPFFGYTHRTTPDRYDEKRYFWPFLVHGRGDGRIVDQWGPFYTHSIIKGVDKTWVMWPLWKKVRWTDGDIVQTQSQFFYFLYSKLEQRSASRPAAPMAEKAHYWPVVSLWDNGAGQKQVQAASPFELLFPHNEEVRETWTPLAAAYRQDEKPGSEHISLLWDAITHTRDESRGTSEFHLGPLLGIRRTPDATRLAIFGLDFRGDPHHSPPQP